MKISYQKMSSPIGSIYLVADEIHLQAITFACNWEHVHKKMGDIECKSNTIIDQAELQLREYFAQERTAFDLPISFHGTVFQKKSWQALLTIPYGETCSYAEQAQLIGKAKAVRAVGRANGQNAIPIVVPCHRVIAKSGKLTGFAGGLGIKKYLLELEGNTIIDMTLLK